jgi:biotin transport system substrate-specific component
MTATGLAGAPTAQGGATLGDYLIPVGLRERAPAWARDIALVVAGAALLILGGYVSFTVPAIQLGQLYVPVNEYVPLTLQTFGVLFIGALLGTRRGVAATGLYLLIGIVGFQVFSADANGVHRSGIETFASLEGGRLIMGTTGGYLLGFLVAAGLVGGLAQRGWDRRLGGSIGAMIIGTLVIYAFGVTWLALAINVSIPDTLGFGLYPFLPGDVLKLLIAAGLLPLGWRYVSRRASESPGGKPDSD